MSAEEGALVSEDQGPVSMNEHWESALTDLRGRLSEENYETWLGPIRFDGFDGRKLSLRIPNRFYADWIRSHYLRR